MSEIEMIVFDLDGTILEYDISNGASWAGISRAAGILEEDEKLKNKYLGNWDIYQEWVEKYVELLKGKDRRKLLEKCLPIPYTNGCDKFLDWASQNYKTGILSNGVGMIAEEVRKQKRLDFAVAQYFEEENFVLTGKINTFYHLSFKADYIEKISKNWRIPLENICYVGDGYNDVEVFKKVGFPVAFCPQTSDIGIVALENEGNIIYDFQDLRYLLS